MDTTWRNGLEILTDIQLPEGYVLAQMSAQEIAAATARLAQWYPEIQVGAESPHLQPEFYLTHTQLADTSEPRDILPLVFRHAEDGVVALMTCQRDLLARAISCRLGALAPEHRRAGLALFGPHILERLGRAIGAEVAHYYATLRTRHQQLIAERQGYQLVGIVPGNDRAQVAPNEVKRVYEAMYSKLLIASEALERPALADLTAHTRAVWSVLFGSNEEL